VHVDWVTAQPEPAVDVLVTDVSESAGAVLVGAAGVGKTEVARHAVERLAPQFTATHWIRGTATQRAIPLGAFGRLIDVAPDGGSAAVLRAARDSLGEGFLLVVDDAHCLDQLSAMLVYQLVVRGSARLILIVDDDQPAPEALSRLWLDGRLRRIDIAPVDHEYTRLQIAIESLVMSLPDGARTVLQYLAVEDPLPLAQLSALAGADAVAEAQQLDVITVNGTDAQPFHPLYSAAVGDAMGPAELRRMRTLLVDLLAEQPADGVVERLRLAVLAVDSDHRLPAADVEAAAHEALRLGDLELTERLGRAALEAAPGPAVTARLPLAYALAWQGRGREADAVLADVDPAQLSEADLMAWAVPTAANQFWMLSEPERATAFLQTTRSRVSTPAARNTLDALAATFAMNAGNPSRAMETASAVLESPDADDTAVGWAAAAAALSTARIGRFAEVDDLAERALSAGHPGLLRFTSGFGQTTRLLMIGEVDRAHALAQQLTDFARQQPGRAIGQVLVADVLLAQGDPAAAVNLLREAAVVLTPTGYSWGPLALMYLAQALGQQSAHSAGEAHAEASKVLARAESRHGLKSMLFAPELALARAWTLAARHDAEGAVEAARDAARAAGRGGQSAMALRALHGAVRLGDSRAADRLAKLSAEVDCLFGRLAAEHARALAAGDEAALAAVSEQFAAIGMHGAAADALAQASGAAR
jgi:hypothetical protein